jgi:D-3-phosphoglycerate dehydrogenase
MTGTAFVAHDPNLAAVVRDVVSGLEAQGWRVLEGPPSPGAGIPFRFDDDTRARYLAEADIAVISSRSRMTADDLDAAPRLRGLVFPSIGVDAVDLEACAERGIIVAHGPIAENFVAMSEVTVMLMLNLLYGLRRTERLFHEMRPRPPLMHARMLTGRTIGVIGMGRIGGGVVRRLAGWGAEILVNDPYIPRDAAGDMARLVDKETLLRASEIVSLHVPLNDETRNLVGAAEIAAMRRGAFLINTSRGGTVDEAALAEALERGHLAGAALDVFDPEPPAAEHPLRARDDVILTPHMVGHTQDLYRAMPEAVLANIARIMAAEMPLHPKNPEIEPAWRSRLEAIRRRSGA